MANFNEYPKHMTHPSYYPGDMGAQKTGAGGHVYWEGGKPARLTPVLVHNADDEACYEAKGYVSQGKSDPDAFARAHAVAAELSNYVPIEYPKWIDGVLVNNATEEARHLAGPQAEPEPIAVDPTSRVAELERQLAEMKAILDAKSETEEPARRHPGRPRKIHDVSEAAE